MTACLELYEGIIMSSYLVIIFNNILYSICQFVVNVVMVQALTKFVKAPLAKVRHFFSYFDLGVIRWIKSKFVGTLLLPVAHEDDLLEESDALERIQQLREELNKVVNYDSDAIRVLFEESQKELSVKINQLKSTKETMGLKLNKLILDEPANLLAVRETFHRLGEEANDRWCEDRSKLQALESNFEDEMEKFVHRSKDISVSKNPVHAKYLSEEEIQFHMELKPYSKCAPEMNPELRFKKEYLQKIDQAKSNVKTSLENLTKVDVDMQKALDNVRSNIIACKNAIKELDHDLIALHKLYDDEFYAWNEKKKKLTELIREAQEVLVRSEIELQATVRILYVWIQGLILLAEIIYYLIYTTNYGFYHFYAFLLYDSVYGPLVCSIVLFGKFFDNNKIRSEVAVVGLLMVLLVLPILFLVIIAAVVYLWVVILFIFCGYIILFVLKHLEPLGKLHNWTPYAILELRAIVFSFLFLAVAFTAAQTFFNYWFMMTNLQPEWTRHENTLQMDQATFKYWAVVQYEYYYRDQSECYLYAALANGMQLIQWI